MITYRTDNHCIQYALVGPDLVLVRGTEKASDEEIRKAIDCSGRIERFNRCPECQVWTTNAGGLRDLNCPAIKDVT